MRKRRLTPIPMIEFGDELLYCYSFSSKDVRVFRYEDIYALEVDLSYTYPMVSPVMLCEESSGVTYTVHQNAGDITNLTIREFLHQCRIRGFRTPQARTVEKHLLEDYVLCLGNKRRKK